MSFLISGVIQGLCFGSILIERSGTISLSERSSERSMKDVKAVFNAFTVIDSSVARRM